MNIFESVEGVEFLSGQFSQARFSMFRSAPEDYITCFVCRLPDESELVSIWRSVSSVIAMDYQAELKSKLDAWNIYLVFVVDGAITKNLKYEIENDKFSMRKLVVEDFTGGLSVIDYLNNEVLGHDLKLKSVFTYKPDSEPEQLIGLHAEVIRLVAEKKASGGAVTTDDVIGLAEWVAKNEV